MSLRRADLSFRGVLPNGVAVCVCVRARARMCVCLIVNGLVATWAVALMNFFSLYLLVLLQLLQCYQSVDSELWIVS